MPLQDLGIWNSNVCAGLPHNTSNHLPNNDPPIPTNPQIRQRIRNGRRRPFLLHSMALGFRSSSELEWDGRLQERVQVEQGCCCIWSFHLVSSQVTAKILARLILTYP